MCVLTGESLTTWILFETWICEWTMDVDLETRSGNELTTWISFDTWICEWATDVDLVFRRGSLWGLKILMTDARIRTWNSFEMWISFGISKWKRAMRAREGLRMWISFKTFGKGRCARARRSDRRFRRFKNCSASRSHTTIPPTKLLPPVAVLRGGFSDGREPGEISFSVHVKNRSNFFFVFLGALPALIL